MQGTENKILEAAEKEFITKGYAAARTISIADAAGVSHAMLHYYFRSKKKLFEKVFIDKIELLRQLLSVTFDTPGLSLRERIENTINVHINFISANPDLPRFFINEIISNPERMDEVKETLTKGITTIADTLQAYIDEGAAKGECRKVDARMLLIDILSLNVFTFIASPLINIISSGGMNNMERFKRLRKEDTIDMIIRKLKP